jgi:hypothetical protein
MKNLEKLNEKAIHNTQTIKGGDNGYEDKYDGTLNSVAEREVVEGGLMP